MTIISCGNCGVMLDTDKISQPDIYKEEEEDNYEVDLKKAFWDGDEYVPKISCPVCKDHISYRTGESV